MVDMPLNQTNTKKQKCDTYYSQVGVPPKRPLQLNKTKK